jgi:hypothetical protein
MSLWELTVPVHEKRIIALTKSAGSVSMFNLLGYCTRCAWSMEGDRLTIARGWMEHVKELEDLSV